MRTYISPIVLATALVAFSSTARSQSFADWVSVKNGDLTGVGAWGGYGTVTYNIDFFDNSDGESGGLHTPARANRNNPADLDPFGIHAPAGVYRWLDIYPGKIDNALDNSNVGYAITFTFSDGAGGDTFPYLDPVFYLSDVDGGNFLITASNDNVPLDVSDWYFATVQVASVAAGAGGTPSYWDPSSSSLIGQGQSTNFVHQFKPTGSFDTLTFTFTNTGPNDRVFFAIGDVAVVPEPSSALLLGASGVLALFSRRRRD